MSFLCPADGEKNKLYDVTFAKNEVYDVTFADGEKKNTHLNIYSESGEPATIEKINEDGTYAISFDLTREGHCKTCKTNCLTIECTRPGPEGTFECRKCGNYCTPVEKREKRRKEFLKNWNGEFSHGGMDDFMGRRLASTRSTGSHGTNTAVLGSIFIALVTLLALLFPRFLTKPRY